MKPISQAPDGLVIVDKPQGLTSHDVVARMRRLAGTRKVGHAGTLDPMATGVLVIGIGRATKLLTHIVGANKTYLATIRLGVGTDTDDADGTVTATATAAGLEQQQVLTAIADFTGDIAQVPSSVSAIKVAGKRAYTLVREGQTVELAARPVHVSRFDVLSQRADEHDGTEVLDLDVVVSCSTGTYIRALARDLGETLGVPGHLTALRRTEVGGYALSQAMTLDGLNAQLEATGHISVLPLRESAQAIFPTRQLTRREASALGYGKRIEFETVPDLTATESVPSAKVDAMRAGPSAPSSDGQLLCGVDPDGALIALLTTVGAQLRPAVVFVPAESR